MLFLTGEAVDSNNTIVDFSNDEYTIIHERIVGVNQTSGITLFQAMNSFYANFFGLNSCQVQFSNPYDEGKPLLALVLDWF